jgi:antitoxin FitA
MSKTLQIRDVPDDVHAAISAKAKAAGMTISQYLLRVVTEDAMRLRNAEVMERARGLEFRRHGRVPREVIVSALREARDER